MNTVDLNMNGYSAQELEGQDAFMVYQKNLNQLGEEGRNTVTLLCRDASRDSHFRPLVENVMT